MDNIKHNKMRGKTGAEFTAQDLSYLVSGLLEPAAALLGQPGRALQLLRSLQEGVDEILVEASLGGDGAGQQQQQQHAGHCREAGQCCRARQPCLTSSAGRGWGSGSCHGRPSPPPAQHHSYLLCCLSSLFTESRAPHGETLTASHPL